MIVSPKWTKVLKIDPKQVASLSDIARSESFGQILLMFPL